MNFIAKSVFFFVNVLEFSPGGTLFCPNKGELNIIVVLPVVFLSVAVVINLRNWIYYYIKIGEMAYKNEQTKDTFRFFKNAKLHTNVLNVFTHVIITGQLLFLVCSTTINIMSTSE
jgi:hypothetical protein